jgi:hypothetical protein
MKGFILTMARSILSVCFLSMLESSMTIATELAIPETEVSSTSTTRIIRMYVTGSVYSSAIGKYASGRRNWLHHCTAMVLTPSPYLGSRVRYGVFSAGFRMALRFGMQEATRAVSPIV